MTNRSSIDCISIGQTFRQTISTLNHKVYERILAGPAFYAAAAIKSRTDNVGVVSAVPTIEKIELCHLLEKYHIDDRSVLFTASSSINEQFLGYLTVYNPPSRQPIPYFSSLKMPLPASIRTSAFQTVSVNQDQNYFPVELSSIYLNASAAHICAADIKLQIKAFTILDKTAISVLTVLSDPGYMIPSEWEMVMNLMNGLSVFITTRGQLTSLFKNRTNDLNEMGKILHAHGCSYLVTINDAEGYELNDLQMNKKYSIPLYPSGMVDPTGTDEAFCGGLLAEMRSSHDPVQAVLCGSVLASIKAEGCGPFFPLEAAPGLIDARINRIKDWVKEI
jgi:hypothetical protein